MSSLSDVRSMDPYDFEKLVARVWSSKGYETNVRKRSNDKGVDIEANSGNHKILIQAKRYSAGSKIGGPDVRKYATLYQQDPNSDQVILVTTSSFTSQAKEIASEQNVTIIDGSEFMNMMNEQSINLNNTNKNNKTLSKSRSNTKSNKYFNKCPVCKADNVYSYRRSGNLHLKCENCESLWRRQSVSGSYGESVSEWRGITSKTRGKVKTTDEWNHHSIDTKSTSNNNTSSGDSSQRPTLGVVGTTIASLILGFITSFPVFFVLMLPVVIISPDSSGGSSIYWIVLFICVTGWYVGLRSG